MIPSARELLLRAIPARFVLRPHCRRLVTGSDVVYAVDRASERVFVLHGEAIRRELANGRLSEFGPSRYCVFSVTDPVAELPWLSAMVEMFVLLCEPTTPTLCWPPSEEPTLNWEGS